MANIESFFLFRFFSAKESSENRGQTALSLRQDVLPGHRLPSAAMAIGEPRK